MCASKGHLAQHRLGDVLYPGEAINDRLLLARLLGTKAGAKRGTQVFWKCLVVVYVFSLFGFDCFLHQMTGRYDHELR